MNRVLIVATTSYAGMGPYVTGIVNQFTAQDEVYYFFHDYADRYFYRNVKAELHEKSTFFVLDNTNINKLKELVLNKEPYERELLELCEKYSIKLVHYLNGAPSLKLMHNFEKIGAKVISTVHDFHPHETNKAWYKVLKLKIRHYRHHECFVHSPFIVTNGMSQYNELRQMFSDKKLLLFPFPSLISHEIIGGKDKPNEMKDLTKPYILFFGRLEAYKGIDLLYRAFSNSTFLSQRFQLVIAGGGEWSMKPVVAKNKNVIFINRYIKDSEIAYLYRNASSVVYPYISATQSGVLSIAFYFGTPVVASNVPFFKDIIEPSQTGLLFETENESDLTEKMIEELALTGEQLNEMRMNQINYYRDFYDENTIRMNLLKFYSDCH
jgi:glycosyltransferase involved in cell wall biosynthesis